MIQTIQHFGCKNVLQYVSESKNDRDEIFFLELERKSVKTLTHPKSKSFCDVEFNDQVVFFSIPPQAVSKQLTFRL